MAGAYFEVDIEKILGDIAITEAAQTEALRAAVYAGGIVIAAHAKIKAPVLTGRLQRSITIQEIIASLTEAEVVVGTNVEYAPYVEFGTYKMAAQPYLRPSLYGHLAEIKEAMISTFLTVVKIFGR